ncbi:RagB/SusD family nutrient uptake outer membrane protein [Niastella vici]|uniref:RagB/SusD family nutrient uptake outer membrane protein n=1 Tax=Niastella vici TaxID=1703345 RepID=UPI001301BBF2|nr:RagB/SusD family nutrient uptake outer membrane protein [Niastella vici]
MDERPNSDVFVPTTLEDFQALLDNEIALSVTPTLGELSADNYYLTADFWKQTIIPKEHNAYIWAEKVFEGESTVEDWNAPYKQVLYANVILDGLKKVPVTSGNLQQWNNMKGSALFIRAYAFYNLAQVFALPYNATTAGNDLGIPLKLTPNVDEVVHRSKLDETYAQILADLLEAKDLLPAEVSYAYRNRPNKPAAFAQLARVYVSMRLYDKAGAYADSCLHLKDTLMDYNNFKDLFTLRPFDKYNPETLYQTKFIETGVLKAGSLTRGCFVDTILYRSYSPNDLRRSLFYQGNSFYANMKGGYTGTLLFFTGLATDEMYLVRAECRARAGDMEGAQKDLNYLLQRRYQTGTFIPYTTSTPNLQDTILNERRKEMPFRGVRWTDIRRLNMEDPNITPMRILDGLPYTLPVNSPKYALPIPPDAMSTGHYIQNER